ncbi:S-adenosyl-L-methionine-dependent methyltransferase [Wilcoxina mikolae CBS 423.85]|nr:S-adenosyl-L-methionine-dependent methyltransferase [Wilcoxina mikolae CBS 423.85]
MSLYLEASSILLETSGSLKSRIYHRPSSSPTLKSPPARLYALIIETLKHQSLLNEVIENSGILGFERKLTHSLALLLLHDHLLTRNGISTSTGPLKTAILNHKARLQAEFTRARLRRGYGSTADLLAAVKKESEAKIPRWVRVNTLRSCLSAVLATLADYSPVESIAELSSGKVYYKDPIVENLLAFPPATDFTTHPLYLSGALILQDRSSCLPAHLLAPPPGAWVVDATAAPGNKTTHLAALLQGGGGGGGVIAFEKDLRRAEVLKKMVHRAGGDELITIRGGSDFLKANPKEEPLQLVSHLLLDPSCSGSGIVSRSEYSLIPLSTPATAPTGKKRKRGGSKPAAPAKSVVINDAEDDEEQEETKSSAATSRLHSLSSFQKSMILHAMTFPSAQKISYSTCSIHAEENEHVVTSVLASKVARRRGWHVEKRADGNLREWERRGIPESCGGDEDVAEACVRCNPIEDGGIGFFVVAFVRDGSIDEENETSPKQQQQQQQEEEEEEEWNGFSDDDEKNITIEPMANIETNPKRQKKKKQKQKKKQK